MSLLPETIRRIDTLVAEAQALGRAPSVILGVVRDGALAHVARAGESPRPDAETQYRIGSISKTMTAAVVMQLRDEGRLALDDPVHRHLPGTPVGGITLRQLLGHVSGLQREPDGEWWERSAGTQVDAFLAGLSPAKLVHPPHRSFHYSNVAYGLLGAVVSRLAGASWFEVVTARLLDPLGLTRTTHQPMEPFARGYVVHPWHGTLREEPRHDAGAMAPAGQLWSTTMDLAKWAAFLANPVGSVLAPETVAEMTAPVVMGDLDAWTSGYGLGIELFRVGERVYIGHGGSMPGYVAGLAVHRPSRTGVVGFANSYGFRTNPIGQVGSLGRRVLTTVLDAEPAAPTPWRPAAALPPEDVAPLCGRWWFMGIEHEASWSAETGELVIDLVGRPMTPWRFVPEGPGRWRGRSGENDGEILTVQRDGDRVVALDIATFPFTREP